MWPGVRGGKNSRLCWAEKAAKFASMIRVLTCQATPSFARTALAWLGLDLHSRCRPARHLVCERVASHVKERGAPDFQLLRREVAPPYTCDPNNTWWLACYRTHRNTVDTSHHWFHASLWPALLWR